MKMSLRYKFYRFNKKKKEHCINFDRQNENNKKNPVLMIRRESKK